MESFLSSKKLGLWVFNGTSGVLVLEDGSVYWGRGFGAEGRVVGEVVFNTGMIGYCEALTDPSYYGQILVLTYPLVGNYGVPEYIEDEWGLARWFESWGIKACGLVVHEACSKPSHWSSARTLDEWLRSEGVPGLEHVDTRALTRRLREKGTMLGVLEVSSSGHSISELKAILARAEMPDSRNLVEHVTVREPAVYGSGPRVVLVDCGVKHSIVRCLLKRSFQVVRVPYSYSASEILELKPEGVVFSNGPGDPSKLMHTATTLRELADEGLPVLGICLGNQLLALAYGGSTYKLRYGHRSQNQPCVDLRTGRCYVTSQNHGYAVDPRSLPPELEVWFKNANDETVEGLWGLEGRVLGTQFHPEASPGPLDCGFVFDMFARRVLHA